MPHLKQNSLLSFINDCHIFDLIFCPLIPAIFSSCYVTNWLCINFLSDRLASIFLLYKSILPTIVRSIFLGQRFQHLTHPVNTQHSLPQVKSKWLIQVFQILCIQLQHTYLNYFLLLLLITNHSFYPLSILLLTFNHMTLIVGF